MSESHDVANERRNSIVLETSLVVGIGLTILVIGTILLAVLSGSVAALIGAPQLLLGALGWRSLLWVGGAILLARLLRDAPRRRRTSANLLVAAGAAVLGILMENATLLMASPGAIVLFAVPWLLGVVAFVGCAALAWMLATRILDRETALLWPVLTAMLLVVGGVLSFSLVFQWALANFTLGGGTAPTDDFGPEGIRYLVVVTSSLALLLAALVIAFVRGMRGPTILAVLLLLLALVLGFVFQVPTGRFWPEPTVHELPADYTPCFGGPDDPGCEGG